jgi:hypothetical protein
MNKKQLLDSIFQNQFKGIKSEPIILNNECEVLIEIRPISNKKIFQTQDEYEESLDLRPEVAAKEIFNFLFDESCIKFWIEITKLIKNHCIQQDEENKKIGIHCPPEGHFVKYFNEAVKE